MNSTIGIIIQARIGSKRLPNKMILDYYNNQGLLENLLIRLKNAKLEVPIILATTENEEDNILEKIAHSHNISCFRGSEDNVLRRFVDTADKFQLKKIIRICADNPLLDLKEMLSLIENFDNNNFDYYSYTLDGVTPTVKTGFGFWAEGVKTESLRSVLKSTDEKHYHEHVTNFIYEHSYQYEVHLEKLHQFSNSLLDLRLTVDTEKDFLLSKEIYGQCMKHKILINPRNIEELVKKNLEWIRIMNLEMQNNLK